MTIRTIPFSAAAMAVTGLALVGLVTVSAAPAAPDKPARAPVAQKAQKAPKARKPAPPLTAEQLLAEAKAATAKGDVQLALRMTEAAIVADPARPETYVALGDLYARAGESEFARSYYQAALEINPSDAAALNAMTALDKTPGGGGEKTAAANDNGRAAGP